MFDKFFVMRLVIAFIPAWLIYMVMAFLDVLAPVGGIDAFIGIPIQMVMGAVICAIALGLVVLVGWPLYLIKHRLVKWICLIICGLLLVGGVVAVKLSRSATYKVWADHPEFGSSCKILVANPSLSIGGWLSIMFGIVHLGGPGFQREDDDSEVLP